MKRCIRCNLPATDRLEGVGYLCWECFHEQWEYELTKWLLEHGRQKARGEVKGEQA